MLGRHRHRKMISVITAFEAVITRLLYVITIALPIRCHCVWARMFGPVLCVRGTAMAPRREDDTLKTSGGVVGACRS